MAVLLRQKKSTYGNPYAYYKVDTTNISNRTATSVDISVEITSRLATSGSTLGVGYSLIGRFYYKGQWSNNIEVKASSASWSGTTEHVKTATFTCSGVGSSDDVLSGIYFQVVSSAADKACQLNTIRCEDLTIPIYHTPPLISGYTIIETNQDLIDADVDDEIFVANLSQKRINITYELFDANFLRAGVYNSNSLLFSDTSLPILADFTQNNLVVRELGVPIFISLTDDEDGRTYYSNAGVSGDLITPDYYSYIPYTPITLLNTTNAKRLGQTSGRVALSINGNLYNNEVGNVDQTSYKPTIKYKFWKYTGNPEDEPSTYDYTIPASAITIDNGTFNVQEYDIGSIVETDINYFDPEYAYRIKVYVEDNFTNTESQELQIQVGEALWSEYKDRVDFKKITINQQPIIVIQDYLKTISSLASGGTTNVNYDITKAGYTPIGVVGIRSSFSALNIYGMRITSDTNAEVSVRNIYTATASNVDLRIYVAYIKQ